MKIFVSSTYVDLAKHRAEVNEVLIRMKHQFAAMEYFGSRGDDAASVCAKEIADCDILLGIYAWRYGWQSTPSQPSITELEFDYAMSKHKKCLCYLVNEEFPWKPAFIDHGDAAVRLRAFKEKVGILVRSKFTTPDNLAKQVAADLNRELNQASAVNAGRLTTVAFDHNRAVDSIPVAKDIDWSLAAKTYLDFIRESYSTAKTLMHRNQTIRINDIYVPPDVQMGGATIREVSAEDLFKCSGQVLLVGAGGSGKSFFCKKSVLELADSRTSIPVLVRFRDMSPRDGEYDFFLEAYRTAKDLGFDIQPAEFLAGIRKGHITLLYDGFDELKIEFRFLAENALSQLLDKVRPSRVIVTSRPMERYLLGLYCHTCEILPLTRTKASLLIRKSLLDPGTSDLLIRSLDDNLFEPPHPVLHTPLLLMVFSITVDVYGQAVERQLAQFYERAFDAMWILHDRTKEGSYERMHPTRLSPGEFQEVFAVFSFMSYADTKTAFSRNDVVEAIDKALSAFKFADDILPNDFLDQCTEVLCLLVNDGATYEFSHKSFQEYYTAYFFCSLGPLNIASAVDVIAEKSGSENVLRFVAQMNRDLFEQSIIIPTLDDWFEYSDASKDGNFDIYVTKSIGEVLVSRAQSTWSGPTRLVTLVNLMSQSYDEFPASCLNGGFAYPCELFDQIETWVSQFTEYRHVLGERQRTNPFIISWEPLVIRLLPSDLPNELAHDLLPAIRRASAVLTEPYFRDVVKFRNSLGTRTITSRRERVDKIAFGR